jgi:Fe(II)/alpha-ketoglutarate-dependent arginine beta-hydroxylase
MNRLILSEADVRLLKELLDDLRGQYRSAADPNFLEQCGMLVGELPRSVRQFLNDFRHSDPSAGAVLISGQPIEDARIGKTPDHWKNAHAEPRTVSEDMLLILYGSLLGDVFCWGTEQGGHIVQEVIPIKSHEQRQMSTGSRQTIWWHTEDAFHPYTSDYVGLMCLRNLQRVATTIACIDEMSLDPEVIEILFQKRFIIHPVESHKRYDETGDGKAQSVDESLYRRIREMTEHPKQTSVLYGDPRSPYLRIDPYYMDVPEDDVEARRALDAFATAVDASLKEFVFEPGDCCLIDNYKAVHGRRPFHAQYNGTDRWLKRVNITRDLRKSRAARTQANSRIIM